MQSHSLMMRQVPLKLTGFLNSPESLWSWSDCQIVLILVSSYLWRGVVVASWRDDFIIVNYYGGIYNSDLYNRLIYSFLTFYPIIYLWIHLSKLYLWRILKHFLTLIQYHICFILLSFNSPHMSFLLQFFCQIFYLFLQLLIFFF